MNPPPPPQSRAKTEEHKAKGERQGSRDGVQRWQWRDTNKRKWLGKNKEKIIKPKIKTGQKDKTEGNADKDVTHEHT